MVKSVLGVFLFITLLFFKAVRKNIDLLEGIRRRFLWGGLNNQRKIYWVSWDLVTLPKHKGGLGVGSLRTLNVALLAKWRWMLKVELESFWYFCIKYLHNFKLINGMPLAKKGISDTWLSIF